MEHMQDIFFGHLKAGSQKQYKEKITMFIQNLKRMQINHTVLLEVGILFVLREQKELLDDVFPDIYSKYQDTSFLVNKLRREDREHIAQRYVVFIENLGKEICDAI